MDKKVFVTGATGLLGSHLLYFLLSTGHEVCALKRMGSDLMAVHRVFKCYPDGEELWGKIVWVEGDVLVKETLTAPIHEAAYVYHCAAMVSFQPEDKPLLVKTNLEGTENVAALCLSGQKRLCYVSSIAALGDASRPGEIIDEDTPVAEGSVHSAYSYSKGDAEKIVWKYIHNGLKAVIVCPSVILGGGHWNRSSARLYFTAAKGLPVYTGGVTGYVDVRDVVRLMVRLAEDTTVEGERFILNGGNYSFRELFSIIAEVNRKRGPWFYLRPWMTETIWRAGALAGKLTRRTSVFSREMARSAQHRSYYSNAKILGLYPDFRFYSLRNTAEQIRLMWQKECGLLN